jgi:hypothetical protein
MDGVGLIKVYCPRNFILTQISRSAKLAGVVLRLRNALATLYYYSINLNILNCWKYNREVFRKIHCTL